VNYEFKLSHVNKCDLIQLIMCEFELSELKINLRLDKFQLKLQIHRNFKKQYGRLGPSRGSDHLVQSIILGFVF